MKDLSNIKIGKPTSESVLKIRMDGEKIISAIKENEKSLKLLQNNLTKLNTKGKIYNIRKQADLQEEIAKFETRIKQLRSQLADSQPKTKQKLV